MDTTRAKRGLPVDDKIEATNDLGMGDTTILLSSGWGMVVTKTKVTRSIEGRRKLCDGFTERHDKEKGMNDNKSYQARNHEDIITMTTKGMRMKTEQLR